MEAYFNIISFIVGIVSIVLSLISIWLAVSAEKNAKSLNDDTRSLLNEIKAMSQNTHQIVTGEADKNSQFIRKIGEKTLASLIEVNTKSTTKPNDS